MKSNNLLIAALAACLIAGYANAAETPTSISSKSKLLDNMKLTFYTLYRGPQLANVGGSSFQPKDTGEIDDGNLQFLESTLAAGYKLSKDLSVSANYNFNLYPLREKDMKLANPSLKIAHTKLYDSGTGTTLAGAFRFYLPVTNSSHNSGLLTSLRADESLNHDLSGSRWSVGLDAQQRNWMFSSDAGLGKDDVLSFYMYFGPYVAYQIRENLGIKTVMEKELFTAHAANAVMNTGYRMDTWVSLSWDINQQFNFSPAIQLYPSNMRMNSVQGFFEFTAKLL